MLFDFTSSPYQSLSRPIVVQHVSSDTGSFNPSKGALPPFHILRPKHCPPDLWCLSPWLHSHSTGVHNTSLPAKQHHPASTGQITDFLQRH